MCLFFAKSSKNLQRRDYDVIVAIMVLSSLSETEEAEEFVWDTENLEACNRIFVVQVVVVSTINFHQ